MASYPEELCNKLMKNKKIGTHTIIFTNPEAEDLYDQLRINKISKSIFINSYSVLIFKFRNPFHRETYPGKSKRTTNNKRNTTCKLCGEFLHDGIFDGFELEDTMVVAIHNLLYHPKLIPMFPTKHSISKRYIKNIINKNSYSERHLPCSHTWILSIQLKINLCVVFVRLQQKQSMTLWSMRHFI